MDIKNIISVSFKNFIRNKKNIISIILIGLIFALSLFTFSFRKSLNDYWNNSVKKLVDYRTYIVSYDEEKYNLNEAIGRLKKVNHMVAVADESSYVISMKVKDKEIDPNNSILLVGTVTNPIKLAYGKNLDNNSFYENQIICSKQFYPYFENSQKDYLKSKSIDITHKLGKNIDLSFINSNEKEAFRIVGLYDAQLNHTEGNICYTNFDVVNKLNKKYQYDVFYNESESSNLIYAVIDNLDNEGKVLDNIRKDGFNLVTPVLSINKDMGNNIIKLISIISVAIIILSIFIIFFLFNNKINNRKKDYSIMKTSGYSNSLISYIYFFELIFEFISAIIISIVLYYIFMIIFQQMYIADKIMFYNLKINIYSFGIIINVLVSFILCYIATICFRIKLKKETIIKLSK